MIVHVDPDPGFTAKVDAGQTVHAHVETYSPGHGGLDLETLDLSENGTYNAPSGKAYNIVNANVPQTTVESKSVTANGTYTAPSGKAYSPVSVNVPQTTIEALSVTQNGTYTAPSGKAYSPITVNVPQNALPSAYQEVEYLETTGQQWIELIVPAGSTVTIDVSINALQETNACFSGAYSSSSEYCYFCFSESDKIKFVRKPYSGSETTEELVTGAVAGTRYQVSGITSLYGAQYRIGSYRNNGYPFTGRLYRVEIETLSDDDRVLVPCYKKRTGKAGFFDLVNGGFYTCTNGYDFVAGPDVN